jgi:hypothetical protein
VPKLTSAQLRALTAVRDRRVSHQIDAFHDIYHCPCGVGGRSVRGLAALGLIADTNDIAYKGVRVRLTGLGSAALAENRK